MRQEWLWLEEEELPNLIHWVIVTTPVCLENSLHEPRQALVRLDDRSTQSDGV